MLRKNSKTLSVFPYYLRVLVVREEEGDEQGKGVLGEKRMTLRAEKDSESKRVRGDLGAAVVYGWTRRKGEERGLEDCCGQNIQLLFS